jgi:chromosome segregation ATPase
MFRPKSLVIVVAIGAGSVGLVLCIAAMIVLWIIRGRLDGVTESAFNRMDQAIDVVSQRVSQTRDRVAEAKITTAEIEEALRDWTKREGGQRLALRLDAAKKSERLATVLQQADQWLEVAESSAGLVQGVLSIRVSTSESSDDNAIDPLIEEIASWRTRLGTAQESVASIQSRLADMSDRKSPGERIEQAVQLAGRVVATMSSISSRIEKFADRVMSAQVRLQELRTGAHRWILIVSIGLTLLILLMATGQIALCRLAWLRRYSQSR